MIEGNKYMFLRADAEDGQMTGKKGQGGVTIFKAASCLVIGTYNQDMAAANSVKELGKMCDYIKEVGY
jgi:hypothetical protein